MGSGEMACPSVGVQAAVRSSMFEQRNKWFSMGPVILMREGSVGAPVWAVPSSQAYSLTVCGHEKEGVDPCVMVVLIHIWV